MRKSIELSHRLWDSHLNLGMSLLRLGQMEKGRAAVERAFKGDPFNIWAKNTLDLLDTMQDFRETKRGSFVIKASEQESDVLATYAGNLLDEAATQNQLLDRATTIAHETAHMWFGDLVTMRWFNDVWMKEVFANFMADKIVNPSFPSVNHELRFLLGHYPSAYGTDRTAGTNAIRQVLDNLDQAGQMYGPIIYDKAPIVMRQLEMIMGAGAFRDGLRDYLKTYQFGNATWLDLVRTLDTRTPRDLAAWSRAWVEERGRPSIVTRVRTGADGRVQSMLPRTHTSSSASASRWMTIPAGAGRCG